MNTEVEEKIFEELILLHNETLEYNSRLDKYPSKELFLLFKGVCSARREVKRIVSWLVGAEVTVENNAIYLMTEDGMGEKVYG